MSKTPAQRAKKHGPAAATAVPRTAAARPRGMQNLPAAPAGTRSPADAEKNANLILIAGLVAAAFLFWYFHLLTLNQMTQLSGGLAMPDSLATGYGADQIGALRAAMDTDAVGQLGYLHKTAGTLFPLIFGAVWLLFIGVKVPRRWLRWVLWALPMAFVAVDLWENFAIDAVLTGAAPEASAVVLASTLTVLRWALLLLSLAAGAAAVLLSRRKNRRDSGTVAGPAPATG